MPQERPIHLPPLPKLPIDALREDCGRELEKNAPLLLEAPPGTGKSTRVPLWAMATLPGLVLLLEPRRIAARMLARHLASLLGCELGATVGLAMRQETARSAATRLLVVTEGVFTRLIREDQALEGVSCVLFDEFHERSLFSDTGLALALESRSVLRPDLRLGVLSATLDADSLLATVPGAHVLRAANPGFPVAEAYRPDPAPGLYSLDARLARLPAHMAAVIADCLGREQGIRLASTSFRWLERFRGASRTWRWRPLRRAGARSCSPRTWPRPRSPSRACASWWTRVCRGDRATIRQRGASAWPSSPFPWPRHGSARAARAARSQDCASSSGAGQAKPACRPLPHPKYSKPIWQAWRWIWRSGEAGQRALPFRPSRPEPPLTKAGSLCRRWALQMEKAVPRRGDARPPALACTRERPAPCSRGPGSARFRKWPCSALFWKRHGRIRPDGDRLTYTKDGTLTLNGEEITADTDRIVSLVGKQFSLEQEKNEAITERMVNEISSQIEQTLIKMAEVVEIPLG